MISGKTSGKPFDLRARLFFIFLVLALAPLVAIGWFSVKTTESLITDMVLRQLQNVAQDKSALLEGWLEERRADMTVIAESSLLKSMDPGLIKPYLDLVRQQYGVYRGFTVISRAGDIVVDSREHDVSENVSGSDIYPVRKTLTMSDITYLPEEGESTFYIAAPVFGENGGLAGTVYGRAGTNKIVFFLLNVSLGQTGECYLVDKDGRFLAHKDPSRILTANITQTGSFENIFQARDGRKAYLDYRGIEVLGASLNVPGTDWYIVVEQDREEAFQSAKKLKLIVLMTILLAIGSAFMLTWIVSRHIVRPIRDLSLQAGLMADSTIDTAALTVDRNDEIGMLYRAFENMYTKLKERQDNLEQTVVMREAELQETGTMLQQTRLIAERSEKFAAMGRMGAAVAHEIRTPLTSLKLFLESVQDQIRLSEDDQEDFRIAMGQIRRMEGVINRFLDFAGPREPVFSEVDVADLIADVVLMVKPLANRQECSLHVRSQEDIPTITGDRQLLVEALINLIVNALEATPGRGAVTIIAAADNFELNGVELAGVRIDIQDTGQGIPEARLETIFEPFYTTKSSGTGLGLPLVLHTVQRHGGIMRVKSGSREGTLFSMFLPLVYDQASRKDHGPAVLA